jgi:hypothetical protein
MQVQCTPDIETLDRLCRLANREAFAIFERRDSCITTSAALMDATLDQANDTDPDFGAEPFVSEIEPAFLTDRHALLWGTTGPSRVRYYPLPGRGGWKSAPAFRLWQRRDLIDAILSAWEG